MHNAYYIACPLAHHTTNNKHSLNSPYLFSFIKYYQFSYRQFPDCANKDMHYPSSLVLVQAASFILRPTSFSSVSGLSKTRMASTSSAASTASSSMFSMEELLSFAGTWKGEGSVFNSLGEEVAKYTEQAVFEPVRKTDTFVVYRHCQDTHRGSSSSSSSSSGGSSSGTASASAGTPPKPMHTETGFWKLSCDGKAVSSFAHPFPSGFIYEMSEGMLERTDDANSGTSSSHTIRLTLTASSFQRATVPEDQEQQEKKQVSGFRRVYTVSSSAGGKGNELLSYKQYLSTQHKTKKDVGGTNISESTCGGLYHHLSCSMTKK